MKLLNEFYTSYAGYRNSITAQIVDDFGNKKGVHKYNYSPWNFYEFCKKELNRLSKYSTIKEADLEEKVKQQSEMIEKLESEIRIKEKNNIKSKKKIIRLKKKLSKAKKEDK